MGHEKAARLRLQVSPESLLLQLKTLMIYPKVKRCTVLTAGCQRIWRNNIKVYGIYYSVTWWYKTIWTPFLQVSLYIHTYSDHLQLHPLNFLSLITSTCILSTFNQISWTYPCTFYVDYLRRKIVGSPNTENLALCLTHCLLYFSLNFLFICFTVPSKATSANGSIPCKEDAKERKGEVIGFI